MYYTVKQIIVVAGTLIQACTQCTCTAKATGAAISIIQCTGGINEEV